MLRNIPQILSFYWPFIIISKFRCQIIQLKYLASIFHNLYRENKFLNLLNDFSYYNLAVNKSNSTEIYMWWRNKIS